MAGTRRGTSRGADGKMDIEVAGMGLGRQLGRADTIRTVRTAPTSGMGLKRLKSHGGWPQAEGSAAERRRRMPEDEVICSGSERMTSVTPRKLTTTKGKEGTGRTLQERARRRTFGRGREAEAVREFETARFSRADADQLQLARRWGRARLRIARSQKKLGRASRPDQRHHPRRRPVFVAFATLSPCTPAPIVLHSMPEISAAAPSHLAAHHRAAPAPLFSRLSAKARHRQKQQSLPPCSRVHAAASSDSPDRIQEPRLLADCCFDSVVRSLDALFSSSQLASDCYRLAFPVWFPLGP
ncbi:uncharacterized protein PV09_05142 [Verruconis gallopava]|uniref:Uncharacterized protein n=1 Tax=Verruconis gallopava TaxID=253628 RepID=A0A0D2AAP0_9PEZI|nr:uncharacterized protein PV09_05142 [Verruconis gallopava]KIW03843.1 hypothetical protein PV09_05142 [Verruconis gallopava]